MPLDARANLIAEIETQDLESGEVAVPLDLFFNGNNDQGSIGCNLGDEQPPIQAFFRSLKELQQDPGVQSVFVRICAVDDDISWPYADTIYVITSLAKEEIEVRVTGLRPSEVVADWLYGKPDAVPEPAPDFQVFSIWWD